MIDDDDATEKAELDPDLTLETLASEEYQALEEALDALTRAMIARHRMISSGSSAISLR